ncbi:MAG: hypothetical protein ABIN58_11060, partial [candidate division WOR-3 bacterium]
MRKWVVVLAALALASCSWIPWFGSKETADKSSQKAAADKAAAEQQRLAEKQPQPGDVRVVDGIEYIYARNRRYMLTPYEPEYIWIRKDQYSPGLFDSLRSPSPAQAKERKDMEDRIAKLEADLQKKGVAPQMGYPAQAMYLPLPGFGYGGVSFNYPSPKMRRRVVILPLQDQTNYRNEHLGELATQRLISRLQNTAAVISVDPTTLGLGSSLPGPAQMVAPNEPHGVQAVVEGMLYAVYITS